MGKKILAIVIFLAVVLIGGYLIVRFASKPAKAPAQDGAGQHHTAVTSSDQTSVTPPQTATTSQSGQSAGGGTSININNKQLQGTFSAGESSDGGSNIQVVEVDFDGSKFTPSAVSIHANDWVFFKNKSTTNMWVASDPHPTHTDYPGFDSKQSIAPGGEYKFQFTKVGNWGYHDHLEPSITGTVSVSQ